MLRVERVEATAVLTIDRIASRNALDEATLGALLDATDDAAKDTSLRAIVLTGANGTFSSGADLQEAQFIRGAEDAAFFADRGATLCSRIEALPVPVVAALEGVTFGGAAELAVACDCRVMARDARVAFKHARMAVTPAWGTMARLVALVGHGAAMRLLLTAQEISAETAASLGLVEEIADPGRALDLAMGWAADIACGSPRAVAEMKALLVGARHDVSAWLGSRERGAFVTTWTGADHTEAVRAYFEKRAPAWQSSGLEATTKRGA